MQTVTTEQRTANTNMNNPSAVSQHPRKPRRPVPSNKQQPDGEIGGMRPRMTTGSGGGPRGVIKSNGQKNNGPPKNRKQQQQQNSHVQLLHHRHNRNNNRHSHPGEPATSSVVSGSQSLTCNSGSFCDVTVGTAASAAPPTSPNGHHSPIRQQQSPSARNLKPKMMRAVDHGTVSSQGNNRSQQQQQQQQHHSGNSRSPGTGNAPGGYSVPMSPRRQAARRKQMNPNNRTRTASSGSDDCGGNSQQQRTPPSRQVSSESLNSPGKKRRPRVNNMANNMMAGAATKGPVSIHMIPVSPTKAASVHHHQQHQRQQHQEDSGWMNFEPDQWPEPPMISTTSSSDENNNYGAKGGQQHGPPVVRRKKRRPRNVPQAAAPDMTTTTTPTTQPSDSTTSSIPTTSLREKLDNDATTGGFRANQYFNSNIEGVSIGPSVENSLSLEKATIVSPGSRKQGYIGRHDSLLSSWGNISALEKKEQQRQQQVQEEQEQEKQQREQQHHPSNSLAGESTSNNNNNHTNDAIHTTSTNNNNNNSNAASPDSVLTPGVTIMKTPQTKLYEYARNCQWDDVTQALRESPRDAFCVGQKDGTTALHLAVMSRSNPMMRDGKMGEEFQPCPMSLIEELIQACPESAIIRCARKRYTPLSYACLVADLGYSMDDAAQMVEIILKHAPDSAFVFTDDGFSALDVHILSYSRFHKQKEEVYSGGRTSTVVLRTLLAEQPSLGQARVYRNKIRGPIELLYRCNTQEFRDALEEETGLTDDAVVAKKKKQRFGSVMSVLTDWWAWKWALLLLKFASIHDTKPGTIFQAVHAAARMVGCPLPIIALAISTFPLQVTERDPRNDLYNLPLHEVCSWRCDQENVAGDPLIASRKFKAIQCLVDEFPEAARMTNNMGETPLQLAIETCTPWHGGLELLVATCPKALKFPRKLRRDDTGFSLSVQNHSALASVNSFDTDNTDPTEAMEGMYPFLIAAVLGGVAPHKQRAPVSYSDEMAREHEINLQKKSLQSVRSIFGLLRARPQLLQKYRETVTAEFLETLEEEEEVLYEEEEVYDDVYEED